MAGKDMREMSEMDAEDEWMVRARENGLFQIRPGYYAPCTYPHGGSVLDDRHPETGETVRDLLFRKDWEARYGVAPAEEGK